MTPENTFDPKRALQEFERLAELDAQARELALCELAHESPALMAEVRALLAVDSHSGVLDRDSPMAGVVAAAEASAALDRSGQSIGAYRLIERVGRGGMGDVYRAERRTAEFQQVVAIKLLRRGLDSEDLLARFAQERRILARLDHPHIARLIDGGSERDGTPYLVMEYVAGEPLTDHARARRLSFAARLPLLIAVCEAVDSAHRQLVVHRDLKPSNVFVTDAGEVKLLDFGIAKLLDGGHAEPHTASGVRVLTPAYAAPEQHRGEEVSTAVDIYALGVLLHELLTGELPRFAPGTEASAIDRVAQAPSAVVSQSPQRSTWTTARELAGDLDIIVLKALHAEPGRRYPSALALAEDLRRFLDGRPITARPDTLGYRVGKFVRRHRGGVAFGLLSLLGIVLALAVAVWQAREARLQASLAQAQLRRAETIKDFTLALFREQDPLDRVRAKARTAAELVANGIGQARQDFADDPALAADVVADLAQIQSNLGDNKQAREHLATVLEWRRQSEGEESIAYAVALAELGGVDLALGQRDTALPGIERAVALLRQLAGPEDIRTSRAEIRLIRLRLEQGQPAEALELAERSVRVHQRHFGDNHIETLRRHYNLGVVLEQLDRLKEAENAFQHALDGYVRRSGALHVQTVYPRVMLADLLRRQRRYAEALPLFGDAITAARESLGSEHPVVGQTAMRLGDLLRRMRRYDEALQSLAEADRVFRPLGAAELGQVQVFRGRLELDRGDPGAAIPAYAEAVQVYERALGADNAFTLSARASLAVARIEAGERARGIAELEQSAAAFQKLTGTGQAERAFVAERLAIAYAADGRHADALAQIDIARDALRSMYGDSHPGLAEVELQGLAIAIQADAVPADAIEQATRAMAILESADGENPAIGEALVTRGRLHARGGDGAQARADIEAGVARLRAAWPGGHVALRAAEQALAELR